VLGRAGSSRRRRRRERRAAAEGSVAGRFGPPPPVVPARHVADSAAGGLGRAERLARIAMAVAAVAAVAVALVATTRTWPTAVAMAVTMAGAEGRAGVGEPGFEFREEVFRGVRSLPSRAALLPQPVDGGLLARQRLERERDRRDYIRAATRRRLLCDLDNFEP